MRRCPDVRAVCLCLCLAKSQVLFLRIAFDRMCKGEGTDSLRTLNIVMNFVCCVCEACLRVTLRVYVCTRTTHNSLKYFSRHKFVCFYFIFGFCIILCDDCVSVPTILVSYLLVYCLCAQLLFHLPFHLFK